MGWRVNELFEEFCPGVSLFVETEYGHGLVTSKRTQKVNLSAQRNVLRFLIVRSDSNFLL